MSGCGDWSFTEGFAYEEFEWSEDKRKINIAKHGIDFVDAAQALLAPHIAATSSRLSEKRSVVIANAAGRAIAVVYVERGSRCRIISARAARRAERKAYQRLLSEGH